MGELAYQHHRSLARHLDLARGDRRSRRRSRRRSATHMPRSPSPRPLCIASLPLARLSSRTRASTRLNQALARLGRSSSLTLLISALPPALSRAKRCLAPRQEAWGPLCLEAPPAAVELTTVASPTTASSRNCRQAHQAGSSIHSRLGELPRSTAVGGRTVRAGGRASLAGSESTVPRRAALSQASTLWLAATGSRAQQWIFAASLQ